MTRAIIIPKRGAPVTVAQVVNLDDRGRYLLFEVQPLAKLAAAP